MRRNARPLATIHLFLCALSLAGGTAQASAGHPVLIGARNYPESTLLAEVAAEMVRTALDVPFLVPDLADSTAAWKALRDGDIDVYPESLAALTAEILHDPALRSIDRVRAALAKHQVRMTAPLGCGDIVLLYRADLPHRAPSSALMLLQLQGLITSEDMQAMLAQTRSDHVLPGTVATDFLHAKLRARAAASASLLRNAKLPWLLAFLLAAALAALAARRWLPTARQVPVH